MSKCSSSVCSIWVGPFLKMNSESILHKLQTKCIHIVIKKNKYIINFLLKLYLKLNTKTITFINLFLLLLSSSRNCEFKMENPLHLVEIWVLGKFIEICLSIVNIFYLIRNLLSKPKASNSFLKYFSLINLFKNQKQKIRFKL